MFGYTSPEEMLAVVTDIGQQLYFEPSRRDEFVRLMSEHGAFTGFEFQARRKDGSVLWVSENVRTIRDDEGKILY